MSTENIAALLELVAQLIEWSEEAGTRVNHARLWRRHDTLLARLHDDGSTAQDALGRVRRAEIDAWVETLNGSLLPDVLRSVAGALAPGQSGIWAGLLQHRRQEAMDRVSRRTRSSVRIFATALRKFRCSPATAHLVEALSGLEQLLEVQHPRVQVGMDDLVRALEHLVRVLSEELPPIAREVLGRLAEDRFLASIDQRSVVEVCKARTRWLDPVWTGSWQELEAGHASVEPSGSWFVPHLQAHYEELRHSREIEHAYSEAIMEDHRRTREIAEEEQRREDERRIAREKAVEAAQKEREEEVLARRAMFAKGEARRIVADRLEASGLTLKSIPEPQRTQLLLEEESRLMMRT
jgi:hypothetical protein